ncbi:MAG: multicopper oxidase domain-containing protein [Deltaproteobacteria bacterium]|nr:multicopper oxidase domain-containing protein [Deltaproteobacteria bacterium]
MEALGLGTPGTPHTRVFDLLNGLDIPTWDGAKRIHFMAIRDKDFSPIGAVYPGPICRVPRGAIFHGNMSGKGPPPHTIHWHGIEPTPINDGVGHCSMEIGNYTYQWQPNFTGTYFYHCHRNTMQHFEFGLFSLLPIDPPDAFFASIASVDPVTGAVTLNAIPVGAGTDGKFRNACNLLTLPASVRAKFSGFVGGDATYGVAGAGDIGVGDPHAFTVPHDVEVIWVPDDRDSIWSDLASNAFQTFPIHGSQPGVNDNFKANAGGSGFFAFNDFHADYFYITGVPVPTHVGGTGIINPSAPPPLGGVGGVASPDGLIPAFWNSGRSGSQIAVNARVGQTIFIRCLDAAYNNIRVTLPVDAVITEWDGRALGVPPFGLYNQAYVLPKNTPIEISVARRFGAIVNESTPISSFAKVEFLDTRGGVLNATALIPFNITA